MNKISGYKHNIQEQEKTICEFESILKITKNKNTNYMLKHIKNL